MDKIVHLFLYMADEGGYVLSLGGDNMGIHDNHILAFGSRNDVGSWQLHLESKVSSHKDLRNIYLEKIN